MSISDTAFFLGMVEVFLCKEKAIETKCVKDIMPSWKKWLESEVDENEKSKM